VSIGYSTSITEAAQLQADFKRSVGLLLQGAADDAWPDAVYGAFVGYQVVNNVEEAVDKGAFLAIVREGTLSARS
jgi:hypothetical protein